MLSERELVPNLAHVILHSFSKLTLLWRGTGEVDGVNEVIYVVTLKN